MTIQSPKLANVKETLNSLVGGHSVAPVATSLKNAIATGNIGKPTTFTTSVSMTLKAVKSLNSTALSNALLLLNKSAKGIVTIQAVVPTQSAVVSRNQISAIPVHLVMPLHIDEVMRTNEETHVTTNTINNSNILEYINAVKSPQINALNVQGNITETYILTNDEQARALTKDKNTGEVMSTIECINVNVLQIWNAINVLANTETLDDQEKHDKLQEAWNRYERLINVFVTKGILVKSNAIYPTPNGLRSMLTAMPGTNTTQVPSLNYTDVYNGSVRSLQQPDLIVGSAIISDKQAMDNGFKYTVLPVTARENKTPLVNEEEISKTMEVASRELIIYDGAGQEVAVSVQVRDVRYSGEAIIKRSRTFFAFTPGTELFFNSTVRPRFVKSGSNAIKFEIGDNGTNFEYKVVQTPSNIAVGDIEIEEFDLDASFEAYDDVSAFNPDDVEIQVQEDLPFNAGSVSSDSEL